MRHDYAEERLTKVKVKGMLCEFSDIRLDRESIPEGKFLYEVADDDSNGEPARIRPGILVNFFGSLVCDKEFEVEPDSRDTIWIYDGEWEWID